MGAILVQLLLMIFYTSWVFLFMGTCVLGLCISSIFPSVLAFTEDILDYKGKLWIWRPLDSNGRFVPEPPPLPLLCLEGCATTVLVTSASTGEMLLQVVFGSVRALFPVVTVTFETSAKIDPLGQMNAAEAVDGALVVPPCR